MVNVILDTNIYGKIVSDVNPQKMIRNIVESPHRVLNFSLIREELRQTAKDKTFKGVKLRPVLLTAYDQIVAIIVIPLTKDITHLAETYYREYKLLGGGVGKKRILNDLRIIACASLKKCDLVVSEDSHLMRGSKVLKAIRIINAKQGIRSPTFISYQELKRIVNAL